MKLNLGCGKDLRKGYVNVDLFSDNPAVLEVDLAKFPWPWKDGVAEEILMLDFLEHFSYWNTHKVLLEARRVLSPTGFVEIQVPDFDHCARAVMQTPPYDCNRCGWTFLEKNERCGKCGQKATRTSKEAIRRLYGGQDFAGNWHYTAFNYTMLVDVMTEMGLGKIEKLERNENGETFYQNWNIKVRAYKADVPFVEWDGEL